MTAEFAPRSDRDIGAPPVVVSNILVIAAAGWTLMRKTTHEIRDDGSLIRRHLPTAPFNPR